MASTTAGSGRSKNMRSRQRRLTSHVVPVMTGDAVPMRVGAASARPGSRPNESSAWHGELGETARRRQRALSRQLPPVERQWLPRIGRTLLRDVPRCAPSTARACGVQWAVRGLSPADRVRQTTGSRGRLRGVPHAAREVQTGRSASVPVAPNRSVRKEEMIALPLLLAAQFVEVGLEAGLTHKHQNGASPRKLMMELVCAKTTLCPATWVRLERPVPALA